MDDELVGNGNIRVTTGLRFTDDYKQQVFQLWYNNGKLSAPDLFTLIPTPATNFNHKPNLATLSRWIRDDFQVRAKDLDMGVREALDTALVTTKVEMLQRHMTVARRMQDIAVKYLEEHEDELSTAAAVRLLVEGVRIERDSVGIPGMLEKMSRKTDDELLEEVKKLVEESPIDFETIEEDDEE